MQDEPVNPPADADEWTDQQWIDWLKATDAAEVPPGGRGPATRAGRVAHSTGGQIVGAAMIGLHLAIYGPPEEKPAIVVEAGEPDEDRPLSVHLDPDHPDRSYLVLPEQTDSDGA